MTILAEPPPSATASPAAAVLRRRMLSPLWLRLFMLAKLPLALAAGVRLRELDAERCAASVPYGWRSTNPFRSTYFAALSMAAELSTGALAMYHVRQAPRSVAMLIVGLEARFEKRATTLTTFTCEAGAALAEAIAKTLRDGEPAAARAETVGRASDGTVVARFAFTWSFKRRD